MNPWQKITIRCNSNVSKLWVVFVGHRASKNVMRDHQRNEILSRILKNECGSELCTCKISRSAWKLLKFRTSRKLGKAAVLQQLSRWRAIILSATCTRIHSQYSHRGAQLSKLHKSSAVCACDWITHIFCEDTVLLRNNRLFYRAYSTA